jgi:hypothetical protein
MIPKYKEFINKSLNESEKAIIGTYNYKGKSYPLWTDDEHNLFIVVNGRTIEVNNESKKIDESKESDKLATEINKSMLKIDDSMSYEDFALSIAKILKDEYGEHNYDPFMKVLHKELGIK